MQFIEKRKKINFLKRVTYLSKAFIPYVKSNKLKSINIYRDYIYSFKSMKLIGKELQSPLGAFNRDL